MTIKGAVSLVGMTYLVALLISNGLAESFDEDFRYPDRATREAAAKNKLLISPTECPLIQAALENLPNQRLVEHRQALLELEERNGR